MIDFKAVLGFLGLLGVAILILIYLLKPNYQQKIISSSYVWKLSLKYRKKRLPINKIRNIIIIICQVLIISLGSFILAQPFIGAAMEEQRNDKIAIVDASVSMLAYQNNGHTRFENAISRVRTLGEDVIAEHGRITVIIAGGKASLEVQADSQEELDVALDKLIDPNYTACCFADADIDGAMAFAETVLADNPKADVLFYTATDYKNSAGVEVVNISEDEWNVAIFNVRLARQGKYYIFYADVANYNGTDDDIAVHCVVTGANDEKETKQEMAYARCRGNNPDTVVFQMKVYSFEEAEFFIDVNDSFSHDNSVSLFGGSRETIRVMYYSSRRNDFFSTIVMENPEVFSEWDVQIFEKTPLDGEVDFVGYDFYIFEHEMPRILPDDGLVLLVNPDIAPDRSGLTLGSRIQLSSGSIWYLQEGESSPIMNLVDPDSIQITEYVKIDSYESYTPLMYFGGDPVFLMKNEPESKVLVLSFSLNMSDLPVTLNFPAMMYNIFDYFFPRPVSQYLYDVNQKITISNVIGETLRIESLEMDQTYDKTQGELPCSFVPSLPGEIFLSQKFFAREFKERVYVKISALQSDFSRTADLISPFVPQERPLLDLDLLIYFAIAMVALAFIERWLQSREQA